MLWFKISMIGFFTATANFSAHKFSDLNQLIILNTQKSLILIFCERFEKDYQAVQPPSFTKLEPVMYDEVSDNKKISESIYSSFLAVLPKIVFLEYSCMNFSAYFFPTSPVKITT